MGKAEQGMRMAEHVNGLCREEGMGMTEHRMVVEHGMTCYPYSLNK
jgi:hypothetical protein